MDSSNLNKYLAGFLGTCFVVMSIGIISDSIFAAPVPEKPGYAIEAAETEGGGEAGVPAAPESVLPLLASASVEAGEATHKKCVACHTVEKGGANKVGPNLWDIVNRPIASHEGFGYSAAMKEFSQGGSVKWDYEHLDHFLASPKGFIKGTAMGFAGVKKVQERADLIAYLRTLSDNPAPLPEASAQDAAATGGEAAQPAADGAAAPAEGGAAPAEGDAAPAEGGAAPAEGGAAPAEGGAAPAEGGATAAPATPVPGEQAAPDEGATAPQTPATGGEAPAQSAPAQ